MSKTMPQSIGRTKTNKKRGMPSGILLLYMCGGGLSVTLIYMLSLIKRSDDMNSSVYRLRLDIHSPTSQELINMNKGETARRIEIEFCENNTAYKLEDNVTAVICISNDTTLYPVKIDGNKVVYEPLAELTGTVGIKDVQVRLMQSMNDTVNPENAETDRLLYSPRFSVAVHDVVNDGSTVEEQAKQEDVIAQINEVLRKADTGEFNGQDGKDGIDGADGYSPEVTITPSEQPSGHYVKITDAEHPQGQEFFVADGERGGTSIPSYTLYGYKTLTTAQKTHNAEQVQKITSDESNAFICTMLTDDFELSLNSLWYYDLPEFEYFDTTTNTHYKYIANADGTVTIEANQNADPSAVQSSTAPTTSTSGAFVGQLCIVNNGTAVYVYKGLISNVHLWMQIPTMKDIPSLAGYATEEYVAEAISTALGSVETELESITTGGGVA